MTIWNQERYNPDVDPHHSFKSETSPLHMMVDQMWDKNELFIREKLVSEILPEKFDLHGVTPESITFVKRDNPLSQPHNISPIHSSHIRQINIDGEIYGAVGICSQPTTGPQLTWFQDIGTTFEYAGKLEDPRESERNNLES